MDNIAKWFQFRLRCTLSFQVSSLIDDTSKWRAQTVNNLADSTGYYGDAVC